MKKIALFFLSLLVLATTGFAENLTLVNQTSYPLKVQKSKIAIQWANSAKDIEDSNNDLIYGLKTNTNTMQFLTQSGKIKLNIPNKAEYFRVLVWSKEGEGDPDLLTNWVDIIPNKTYTLQDDELVPAVLMSGVGC